LLHDLPNAMQESAVAIDPSPRPASESSADPVLSVIVLTHNEEINLPACLDSLKDLSCKVFVVDSGSTDRTLEIAAARGVAVYQHPFENYASQRNWAQQNLPLSGMWVLHLDSDERLTTELVGEINQVTAQPPRDIAGFMLRKRTIFMGRWIRHGGHYPSYHLRLFKSSRGRCEDRLYDQHFIVEGRVDRLKHDYLDVVATSLSSWTVRHVRWAGLEASEILAQGQGGRQVVPAAFGNPIQRRRWWRNAYARGPLFFRGFLYWVYRYFFRLGFLDGIPGLIFHFLQGFWFRFLIDATIYERSLLPPGAE
jgi:glycosyltransferase involved in cell wall biosynthesis